MPAIHQFLPTLEPGAIGDHALLVQQSLHDRGYESEIFREFAQGDYESIGYIHTDYGSRIKSNHDDVLMYHMAIGSGVADFLIGCKQRLVVAHHNITPAKYYQPWDAGVSYAMVWARDQLAKLASRASLGIGMSEYNRRELETLHYKKTAVAPILLEFSPMKTKVESKDKIGADWLFVGWIAPHKCQHDVIRAFSIYRKIYDKNARLHLVGRVGQENYFGVCKKLTQELGLQEAVSFPGRVSDDQLEEFYNLADVLVCLSEHEGVGLPLLDAMHREVPIVAFNAAAVAETVGKAGLVLESKKPAIVAAAVNRAVSDTKLKQQLVTQGRIQLERFSLEQAKARLFGALEML